jgi:hypothetical protein
MARSFGGPTRREGLVVRFFTKLGENWVGNFHGHFGIDGVLEHPDNRLVVVLSRGQGYLVDPDTPDYVAMFGGGITEFLPLPEFDAILFTDGIRLEAINKDGPWWRSSRISGDGIRRLRNEGATIYGEAFTPLGDAWVPFSFDLRTGKCEGSIYEQSLCGSHLECKHLAQRTRKSKPSHRVALRADHPAKAPTCWQRAASPSLCHKQTTGG